MLDPSHLFLLAWAGLNFWGLGQIWFRQVVIYPLFGHVGASEFAAYSRAYGRRIPLPVIVPGFARFLLPVPLALLGPTVLLWMSAVNVGARLVGLLVTVGLEIPREVRRGLDGKNDAVIRELVRFNWLRPLSFTTSAAVTMAMLMHVFGTP